MIRHLVGHLAVALLASFFILWRTGSLGAAGLCFLASFAMDSDHLVDYWLAYGFRLNLREFFDANYFKINKKTVVPFHSWELVLTFFLLSLIIKQYSLPFFSIGLAMLTHLIFDVISYGIFPLDYSFIYRGLHNFRMRSQ